MRSRAATIERRTAHGVCLIHRASAGFTLLELLLVVVVIAILAAVVLPSAQPAVVDQLRSTAQIVATELAYARSLAVANNGNYKITFDFRGNRCVLTYSGTNAALRQLPDSPFSSPGDPPDQHIADLDNLPRVGPAVRLTAAGTSASLQAVNSVEFAPFGQTIRAEATKVWLAAGGGSSTRYITIEVNPVTGMARAGECTSVAPPAGVLPAP
jgi:prepilin-type N-terminal cleavage/methylation domain-containing protein